MKDRQNNSLLNRKYASSTTAFNFGGADGRGENEVR